MVDIVDISSEVSVSELKNPSVIVEENIDSCDDVMDDDMLYKKEIVGWPMSLVLLMDVIMMVGVVIAVLEDTTNIEKFLDTDVVEILVFSDSELDGDSNSLDDIILEVEFIDWMVVELVTVVDDVVVVTVTSVGNGFGNISVSWKVDVDVLMGEEDWSKFKLDCNVGDDWMIDTSDWLNKDESNIWIPGVDGCIIEDRYIVGDMCWVAVVESVDE